MLRDRNLVPLSRQHQHALALCVRIDRALPIGEADLSAWQGEITQLFESEIRIHFAAEEQALFPAARKFPELITLIDELLVDHIALRGFFGNAAAGQMSALDLSAFGQRLSAHIRKEERRLFERMQGLMNQDELALLGTNLEEALKDTTQLCIVPNDATRLRLTK